MSKALACLAALSAGIMSLLVPAGDVRANTVVRFTVNAQLNTANGPINGFDLELFDDAAPVTVANFLRYVQDGRYTGTIIHRDVFNFVMQGGGYVPVSNGQFVASLDPIPTYGTIVNEFDPSRSNLYGTVAMAKVGGDPNSATSEWFVNLGDNSANLDAQNGGFTVFGQVIGNGMTLIEAVDSVGAYNLNEYYDPSYAARVAADPVNGPNEGPFAEVPLFNNGNTFFVVNSVSIVPEPGALGLAGAGVLALAARRRRR